MKLFQIDGLASILLTIMLTCTISHGAAASNTYPIPKTGQLSKEAENSRRDLGIEIVGLGLSGADYMLDFRYRVTDPVKAAKVINKRNKPVLIDEKTGAKVVVPFLPKLGTMRHTGGNLKKGKMYFALFANPGRFIKRGAQVTIKLGDYQLKHLLVN